MCSFWRPLDNLDLKLIERNLNSTIFITPARQQTSLLSSPDPCRSWHCLILKFSASMNKKNRAEKLCNPYVAVWFARKKMKQCSVLPKRLKDWMQIFHRANPCGNIMPQSCFNFKKKTMWRVILAEYENSYKKMHIMPPEWCNRRTIASSCVAESSREPNWPQNWLREEGMSLCPLSGSDASHSWTSLSLCNAERGWIALSFECVSLLPGVA